MQQAAQEQRDDLWLVLPHLGPGGAQKVALLAASFFGAKGWRVRLVTMLPGPDQAHTIPEGLLVTCLLYTSPSPRDGLLSRMPSSA